MWLDLHLRIQCLAGIDGVGETGRMASFTDCLAGILPAPIVFNMNFSLLYWGSKDVLELPLSVVNISC